MDLTRYVVMSGLNVATTMPYEDAYPEEQDDWKPRDDMCGY
jgi:hypothetical protein